MEVQKTYSHQTIKLWYNGIEGLRSFSAPFLGWRVDGWNRCDLW